MFPDLLNYAPTSDTMALDVPESPSLVERIEAKVRQLTHGRIRNLVVQEIQGQVIVSGQAPSRHAKQLALHGALELLSGDRFSEKITVG
jgi:hypothetical protein